MRDRALGSIIRLYFTTHTLATGALIAPSAAFVAADFRIYKDGSATEKATANGITVTSPFDGVVGTHLIEMDSGNNTGDAGFWVSGSVYRVVANSAKTVDGRDVSGVMIGEASIEVQTADVRKFGGVVGTFAAGIPDTKVASIAANAITAVSIANDAITAAKIADGAIDAATFAAGAIDAAAIATDAIGSNEISAAAVTKIQAGLATPTNITAGVITTVTTLTNLPVIPSNWLTSAGIAAAALNGKGDWNTIIPTNLTAAQIATGVWTDTTAGDFTVALSVGRSLMNGVTLGTGLTIVSVSGAVGSVTGLTASNLDATISSRMATYVQPTGFLAATFPTTIASTTNITSGTITTATNVTTVNGLAANVITATSIAADAITDAKVASDVTIASVTGAVGSVTSVTPIADAILSRSVSNVEAIAGEHTLCTMILGALEWSISGSTLTIKRTDGTTTHYTKTLASAAFASTIIVGLD